jgi:hypothetical protein
MEFPSIPAEVTNGFETLPISRQASNLSGTPNKVLRLVGSNFDCTRHSVNFVRWKHGKVEKFSFFSIRLSG